MNKLHTNPTKPPYGEACNQCGLCCMANLCALGTVIFGPKKGPCPALQETPQGYVCGLVVSPATYAPNNSERYGAARLSRAAELLIGAGNGCDAQLESEPDNPAFRESLAKAYRSPATAKRVARAAKLWGLKMKLRPKDWATRVQKFEDRTLDDEQ